MLLLLSSIICSAMISVVMRLSQGKIRAKTSLLAANYLTCMACGWFFLTEKTLLPTAQGSSLTLIMGTLNGCIYLASLKLSQYNIRTNGVVLSSVFSKIGDLMVPFVVAVALFGERPLPFQIFGAALALGAIIAMNYEGGQKAGKMLPLLILFGVDGLAGAMSKIYGEVGSAELSPHFLWYTFGVAFLLCVVILLANKERPGIWELLFGIGIGVPNFFSSRFLLRALETIPAVVAYPVRSVGSITLVALAGIFLFRERLQSRQWLAIGAIVIAVVLLSI